MENSRLATVIQKAKDANLPKEKIAHCLNPNRAGAMQNFIYEVSAHGGVGFLVEVETDNGNRAINSISTITSKLGGQMKAGSVLHSFRRFGRITLDGGLVEEEALMDVALEAGADDVKVIESEDMSNDDPEEEAIQFPSGGFDVQTTFEAFSKVCKALSASGMDDALIHGRTGMVWESEMLVEQDSLEEEAAENNAKLLSRFQEMEDVTAVWHNMAD